jgi:DNA-binding IclR family transcriptional regulator
VEKPEINSKRRRAGVAVVSRPIFYPNKKLAGALSVLGIHVRHDISPDGLSATKLLDKVKVISNQLGYKGEFIFNQE